MWQREEIQALLSWNVGRGGRANDPRDLDRVRSERIHDQPADPAGPVALGVRRRAAGRGDQQRGDAARILIVQNALDAAACQEIVQACAPVKGVSSTIGASDGTAGNFKSEVRTSDFIDVRQLSVNIPAMIERIFRNYVEPNYNVSIDWFELPEILRYGPGGEYAVHADAENWNAGKQRWERIKDRDLSLLLYIDDGFTGGEIDFPNFGMKLPPKRGLLIVFPSDGRYVHAARPVTSGVRHVIVSWAATKNAALHGRKPPPGAIVLSE